MDIKKILEKADIKINGDRPWDIQVLNDRFYREVALKGSMGAGESWVAGDWDAAALDETFFRLLRTLQDQAIPLTFPDIIQRIRRLFFNNQSVARAFIVGQEHYDLDFDLFFHMLDKRLAYSCGYWQNAKNLDEAQEHKVDLICRKLGLKPGMSVLDVGSGFGSFSIYAAEKYGVKVDGVTVSESQVKESRQRGEGLPVNFELKDWRSIQGKWDRIVSIGQFEHVGSKNYAAFMKKMRSCLNPDGLFLLHTIGNDVTTRTTNPWIEKYIFPNGEIPSLSQLTTAIEGNFVVEDLHNFGSDYDKTLMAWYHNFAAHYPNKTDPFYRLWVYYLLSCAGTFRARKLQLWQLVLSPEGILGGWKRIS